MLFFPSWWLGAVFVPTWMNGCTSVKLTEYYFLELELYDPVVWENIIEQDDR